MDKPVTNEMPSAAASANKQPPMSPAPDGGGVLPYGGNNFPAPNKFQGTTGQSFFAEGGVVGDQAPEQAPAPAADLSSIVRGALQYGRNQSGLPTSFDQGPDAQPAAPTPSFDDGGVVPDVPQEGAPDPSMEQPQQQGGSSMPDPRKAMSYLTGDGAIAADIVSALGNGVDPDGTMDPGERFSKTLTQAPSPDAAWGILQHGRTRFNAYSAAAKVAMDRGDLGRAAMYATQAFDHAPTGQSVKFAPGQGGLMMTTRPYPSAAQQAPAPAYGMGGAVDASNPDNTAAEDNEQDQSFADGGEVEEPDSEGVIPSDAPSETPDDELTTGGVNTANTNNGAGYTSWSDPATTNAAGNKTWQEHMVAQPDARSSIRTQGPQPATLTGQQVKALLDAGYDKIIEGAMEQSAPPGTPDDDVTGSATAPGFDPNDPMTGAPQPDWSYSPISGAVDAVKNWWNKPSNPDMDAPAESNPMLRGAIDTTKKWWNDNDPKKVGMRGFSGPKPAGPEAGVMKTVPEAPPAQQEPADYGEEQTHDTSQLQPKPKSEPTAPAAPPKRPDDEWQTRYETLQRRANQLFPMVGGDMGRRQAYIDREMGLEGGHRDKMELEQVKANNKATEGAANRGSRETIAHERVESSELRNRGNNMSKERIAAAQQLTKMYEGAQGREASILKTRLINSPDFENSPEFKATLAQLQKQSGKSPDAIMDMLALMQKGGGQGGPSQGPSPQGQQGQGQAQSAVARAPSGTVFRDKEGRQFVKRDDGKLYPIQGAQ